MIDIELSSLPEAVPTQNIPHNPGYFRRLKQGAASLVGEMGRFIPSYLRENGSESSPSPVMISPWERLIDYSSVGYYYTAVSTSMPTTKGFLSYEGAFISNLSEFMPSLNKYWPTQILICEYYSRLYINLRGRLPSFLISAPATVCPIPHHPCPAVTPLPSIPTIVVTDVDGSRAGCYNAMHETQRILGEANPFLWREWTGRFSPVRVPENVFYDGAPPMSEDEEDEARVGAKCSQQGTNYQSEEISQGNVPRELEWWEREDESEDEVEESDSDFDEEDSEEESEEEDSEDDGDDEYEDDSDDDSDVDSGTEEDLDEASADHVRSITSSVSAVKTTAPLLCEPNAQHPISIQSQAITSGSCQLPQGLEEANDLGISLSSSLSSASCFSLDDSDLESSNSSTTVSSVPTPITPTSPSITTIDSSDLQKHQRRDCNELPETSWLLMNSLDTALGVAQKAEMEMEFQISLQRGVRAGGMPLSIEGLDLAESNHQDYESNA